MQFILEHPYAFTILIIIGLLIIHDISVHWSNTKILSKYYEGYKQGRFDAEMDKLNSKKE